MKYIIKYTSPKTNAVSYIEADSISEFAVEYMGFDVRQNDRGGWDVLLLGKKLPTIHTNGQLRKY